MCREDAEGMVKETAPDPDVAKAKRREDRKRAKQYRTAIAAGDWTGVARIFIAGKAALTAPPSDECADCLALNRRIVA